MTVFANLRPANETLRSVGLGRHKMSDERLALRVILLDCVLQNAVGTGHALMLPQMLKPGLDKKRFDEALRHSRVLIDAPGIGPVALALALQFVQGREKGGTVLEVNLVIDGHHHGSCIGLQSGGRHRCRPVHGRREIRPRT